MTDTIPDIDNTTTIIKFKFNEDLPFGYNITFTPTDTTEGIDHINNINNEATEFVNNYNKELTFDEFINELHHIGSVFATQLNLKLAGRLEMGDTDYNNAVIMFCLSVFILSQVGAVDGNRSGFEVSHNLVNTMVELTKNDTYINQTIMNQFKGNQE